MRKFKFIYLTMLLALFSLGCEESNGYYSSMQDSDTENFFVGKNEFIEMNFSANQIGDKVNIIIYQNTNYSGMKSGLLFSELTGNVNGIDFMKAKKKVYFGADEMEFTNFKELAGNKNFREYSGNSQYYFTFNKSDFENIDKLNIDLVCKVKSDAHEFVFETNVDLKRHVRIQIHP